MPLTLAPCTAACAARRPGRSSISWDVVERDQRAGCRPNRVVGRSAPSGPPQRLRGVVAGQFGDSPPGLSSRSTFRASPQAVSVTSRRPAARPGPSLIGAHAPRSALDRRSPRPPRRRSARTQAGRGRSTRSRPPVAPGFARGSRGALKLRRAPSGSAPSTRANSASRRGAAGPAPSQASRPSSRVKPALARPSSGAVRREHRLPVCPAQPVRDARPLRRGQQLHLLPGRAADRAGGQGRGARGRGGPPAPRPGASRPGSGSGPPWSRPLSAPG